MNYRFLINDPPVWQHFKSSIERDQQMARMPWKFRAYYGVARPVLPLWLRQILQGAYRVGADEDWYLPREFLSKLAELLPDTASPMVHPWPHRADFGFVLTHDVESTEGMQHILAIADIEQSLGFRSSWNIVPHLYPIDRGVLRELDQRGFEVGVHGYNHDGRLFLSKRIFDRRAEAIRRAAGDFNSVGFRAPMMHRNLRWLQGLDLLYDASFFDVDPYQPMPGGIRMVWPFIANGLVVLPTTLPQDHTVFVVMKHDDARVWKRKLQFLRHARGLALMLTHPDYLISPRRQDIYRSFLEHVREVGSYWHGLPRDAATWWCDRDASHVDAQLEAVIGPAAAQGSISHLIGDGDRLNVVNAVST